MPNGWIDHVKLTDETEIIINGVKEHDYLDMGQTFDENVYPLLYAALGTNVLDAMTPPTGSPYGYKIVADATQRIHTEQYTEQYT